MTKRTPQQSNSEPIPGVHKGDELYFRHATGPAAGKVLAVGKHGVTLDHDGERRPVYWHDILGHKKRVEHAMTLVEQGEDGMVVQGEDGKRHFIAGQLPDPDQDGDADVAGLDTDDDYQEPSHMKKSLGDAPILFLKSPRPGLALQVVTDKAGHQTHRWKRTMQDQPAQKPAPKAQPAEGQDSPHGDHPLGVGKVVNINAGALKGKGKIVAAGKDGATVQDEHGREHGVHWHEITGSDEAAAAPAGGKDAAAAPEGADTPAGDGDQKGGGNGGGDGGDGGQPKPVPPEHFNAAQFAKSQDKADVTADWVLSHFPADTKAKIANVEQRLEGLPQTIDTYKKNGEYTPERQKEHDKIIAKFLSPEAIEAARPPEGQKPTFTILGGRGGSGKSGFKGVVYDPAKTIVLDADAIKEMIPEYKGWNAAEVHEESGDLFDKITDMAQSMGLNIVHDATMKTPEKAVKLVQRFKDAGYGVEAHYMHLPRQEAAKRAVGRFLNGGDKEKGHEGRYVPVDVVLGNTKNEQSFDAVKHLVDKWSFRDNNVPKGQPPRLISESAPSDVSGKNGGQGGDGGKPGAGDADERAGATPKAGDSFIAYRAGVEGDKDLGGRNAGNADGVADHLIRQEDPTKPAHRTSGEKATHVHAYRVKLKGDMSGDYKLHNGGKEGDQGQDQGGAVGRRDISHKKDGKVLNYSFPKGGDYEAEHLGSVPIKDLHEHLKKKEPKYHELGDHGTYEVGRAIRELHGHGSFSHGDDDKPLQKSNNERTILLWSVKK